jgi:hypothetical protein
MKIGDGANGVPVSGAAQPGQTHETVQPSGTLKQQDHETSLKNAIDQAVQLFDHVISAVQGAGHPSGGNDVQNIKDSFENKDKDLQNQDKLGNFEIQGLMSDYNEANTLASNAVKSMDDAANDVLRKHRKP